MGEKETMTDENAAARSGTLNVSASPGGSASAGILSAAVSSVSQLDVAGDADAARSRLNSRPTADVTIPLSSDRVSSSGDAVPPGPLAATTVKSSKSNSSE